jgi:plasmid segregation protein ParM
MNAIVRVSDVGFGNTKFDTASANSKVDCAHFASLAFFGHSGEVADSMGEKCRTVQVPVDGLLYEVGPDVELAAAIGIAASFTPTDEGGARGRRPP